MWRGDSHRGVQFGKQEDNAAAAQLPSPPQSRSINCYVKQYEINHLLLL